jgi:G3E family GTPase
MNEFGSVGIDGRLIDYHPTDLVELQKGSIFCVCIRDDFLAAMKELAEGSKPELVVIEATGVADPFEMGDFLAYPELGGVYRLFGTITMVDAVNFTKVIQTMRAARAQAQAADVFVITKPDMVDEGHLTRLRELLTELNADAVQLVAPYGRLNQAEWDMILSLPAEALGERVPARDPMVSITIPAGPFGSTVEACETIAAALPANVLRAKGFVDIGGRPHLLQYTMGRVEVAEAADDAEPVGQLVVIGINLKRDQIDV